MAKTILSILILVTIATSLKAQNTDSTTEYSFPKIGWKIILPSSYKQWNTVEVDRDKLEEKGTKMLLSANGYDTVTKIEAYENLISLHPDQFNYMDAVMHTFDFKTEGDWNSTVQALHQMVAKTFEVQAPEAKMDTVTTWEEISNVQLTHFSLTLIIKEGFPKLQMDFFATLINGYDVGFNFVYLNKEGSIGKDFLQLFYQSKFVRIQKKSNEGLKLKGTKIDVKN